MWDRRAEETVMVPDHRPRNERPKRPDRKYKTLFAILDVDPDGHSEDPLVGEERSRTAEMLADAFDDEAVDWAAFGYE